MAVRAKFICQGKEHDTSDPTHGTVYLEAVTSGSAENESFFKWTPSGNLRMGTLNPAAFEQFEPGKEYYIDISPALEPVQRLNDGEADSDWSDRVEHGTYDPVTDEVHPR